jgi:hypothetical protein
MVFTNRRVFLEQLATTVATARIAATGAVAAGTARAATPAAAPGAKPASSAQAASAPARPIVKLDEKDVMAVALGFVADSTQADIKKYPKHSDEQKCGNCHLFGAAAGSATGPCAIFSGKYVPAAGWCVSWDKRAVLKVDPKLDPKLDPKSDLKADPKALPKTDPQGASKVLPK